MEAVFLERLVETVSSVLTEDRRSVAANAETREELVERCTAELTIEEEADFLTVEVVAEEWATDWLAVVEEEVEEEANRLEE
jgi:hypothetical protein